MKDSIRNKLEKLLERHEEVSGLLADPQIISNNDQFRELSMEYARLEPVVARYRDYQQLLGERANAQEMVDGDDPEMRDLGREELGSLTARIERETDELARLLLPKDVRDESNIYLEVRAGTGGDEAAIFAGDLFRMYSRYAERQGWRVELLSESSGEHGGYKEVISRIVGRGAFSRLKFEAGTHRVQRVPAGEVFDAGVRSRPRGTISGAGHTTQEGSDERGLRIDHSRQHRWRRLARPSAVPCGPRRQPAAPPAPARRPRPARRR